MRRSSRKQSRPQFSSENAGATLCSAENETEQMWRWLSLGLLVNRHCAEFIDDEIIAEHLRHVWATQRDQLPFCTD